ncbi:MAG: carotenoid oxygenase, partial [Rhodospirillaceae bacterium]|nr:carotenoid oxygenase [Rhodospirillaceae bacterium]
TRFVYCPTSLGKGAEGFNALMRMDTDSGHLTTFAFETEDSVGKPVFAPNPQGTAEDDGWVMAFVYDDASDNSHLVLWDARAIEDGPTCRILMPRRIPEGLHGNWMPDL